MNWDKDIKLKIVSIGLAIFMWLYIINVQNPETTVTINDIKISLINQESTENFGLMIVDDSVEPLTLKISGRRKDVSTINNNNIKAYADLKGINRAGEFPIMVQVDLPLDDVKIIDKKPYNINVELDSIEEIQKSVTVVPLGKLKEPYVALEPTVYPNQITITGPSSVVNTIEDVQVKVEIGNGTKDIITNKDVEFYDSNNEQIINGNLKADINNVKVTYPIKMRKLVPVQANTDGVPYGSYVVEKVEVLPSMVNIVGDEDHISNIEKIFTEPIDINGLNENKKLSVPLKLPDGVDVYKVSNLAEVSIDVGREIIRTISIGDLNIYNLPEDLSYNLFTDEINVTLKGMEEDLINYTEDDILASIDLSSYDEGEHVVPVDIIVDPDIEVLGSYNALVKLKRVNENGNNTTPPGDNNTDDNAEGNNIE